MKYSKRYIIFTTFLILFLGFYFIQTRVDGGTVERFRGGSMQQSVWNPMVAAEVNRQAIKVTIDNKEYAGSQYGFYMDENRNVMAPVTMLRDALNCSAFIYDDRELLVEKHNLWARFSLNAKTALTSEGEELDVSSGLVEKDGEFFISLNDLSDLLSYNWSFDYGENGMITADTSESTSVVPASYDLRTRERVSKIRDQGSYLTCWAFAATSAVESSLLPSQKELFSVDHMTMSNSFDTDQYDGGEDTMGMAYLAAWQGPVYEKDDPYGDGISDDTLEPVAHVQQMRIIDAKDFDGIKTAVFKYGGVQTSLYNTLHSSSPYSEYYNSETSAYCYIGKEKPNHDVLIIGWDDNYSKDNFQSEVEGDGAFICQNSWGEEFGEDGVFYVSYYDTNIGTHNIVYTGIEGTDNYDHIYQSDLCGWIGKIGYEKESIYGANVFEAESDETIEAASFYATGANTEFELYVVKNFDGKDSLQKRTKVAAGVVERAGYYTIPLEKKMEVDRGEKYAIVLYIKTPGATHPLAIEYDTGEESLRSIDLEDGEGYISSKGTKFDNVKEKQDCNLCIKAFTKNR